MRRKTWNGITRTWLFLWAVIIGLMVIYVMYIFGSPFYLALGFGFIASLITELGNDL